MSILVTGAAGFIGTHLCRALRAAGHQVHGIDSFVHQVHGDRRSAPGVETTNVGQAAIQWRKDPGMWADVDTIVHLAAEVGVGQSQYEPARYCKANALETAMLWEAIMAHREHISRVIVASSMSCYGEGEYVIGLDRPGSTGGGARLVRDVARGWDRFAWCWPDGKRQPITDALEPRRTREHKIPEPASVYALSKLDTEQYSLLLGGVYDIPTAALRFFNCYSDDTELLTADGFKLFCDLDGSEELATLNPDTAALEYHRAVAWQRHDHHGPMYHLHSVSHDLLVTPDHNLFVKPTLRTSFRMMAARNVAQARAGYAYRLKRIADAWCGREVATYSLPGYQDALGRMWDTERTVDMGDWCEFLGWYISEGCSFVAGKNRRATICISQHRQVHPTYYDRIVALSRRLGFNPYLPKDGRSILITSRQLYHELQRIVPGDQRTRRIPSMIKGLAQPYLRRLYDALMMGDGNRAGERYTTVSPGLADDFIELCLKLGKAATMYCEPGTNDRSPCYRLSITTGQEPQLGDNRTKKVYHEIIEYHGYVYDVTVPNHIIYVRRNGRSCWSSNCYGPGQALSNPYTGVLMQFACRALNREAPIVYEDGKQLRDFIHVEDIVRALEAAIRTPALTGAVNVCTGVGTSVGDLAMKWIGLARQEGIDAPDPEIRSQYRKGDVRACIGDPGVLQRATGWEAQISLDEGLQRTMTDLQRTERATMVHDRSAQANEELRQHGLLVEPGVR